MVTYSYIFALLLVLFMLTERRSHVGGENGVKTAFLLYFLTNDNYKKYLDSITAHSESLTASDIFWSLFLSFSSVWAVIKVIFHLYFPVWRLQFISDIPRFSRGSVQTILPLNRRLRTGRLCGSYDEKIKDLERAALHVQEEAQQCRKRKRDSEERHQDLQQHQQNVKVIAEWKTTYSSPVENPVLTIYLCYCCLLSFNRHVYYPVFPSFCVEEVL